MVEGARLESEYTAKPYRGFESLPLRHFGSADIASAEPARAIRLAAAIVPSLITTTGLAVWKSGRQTAPAPLLIRYTDADVLPSEILQSKCRRWCPFSTHCGRSPLRPAFDPKQTLDAAAYLFCRQADAAGYRATQGGELSQEIRFRGRVGRWTPAELTLWCLRALGLPIQSMGTPPGQTGGVYRIWASCFRPERSFAIRGSAAVTAP